MERHCITMNDCTAMVSYQCYYRFHIKTLSTPHVHLVLNTVTYREVKQMRKLNNFLDDAIVVSGERREEGGERRERVVKIVAKC